MGEIIAIMTLVITGLTEHAKRIFHLKGNKVILVALCTGLLTGIAWKPLAGWFPIPDGVLSIPQYICLGLFSGGIVAGLWGSLASLVKKGKR